MERRLKKPMSIPVQTSGLCKFGCGQPAIFINRSGGLMCSKSANSCPSNKKKNSSGLKNCYNNGRNAKAIYQNMSLESKNSMNHSKGKTAENYAPIAQRLDAWTKNYHIHQCNKMPRGVAADINLRWKRNYIPYIDSAGNEFKLESMHEWEVANLLDKNKIHWVRPNRIKISSGVSYEPDFYLQEFDIYLDPKARWKGKPSSTSQGYEHQQKQLDKISQCEVEHNIKCLILWAEDKRSHSWNGILDQIKEYNARMMEWNT